MEKNIPVDSYVAMIAGNNNYNGECLFSTKYKKNYVIPVYQRPYSWGESNIDDFLQTIMDGFYSNEMKFFGTMQFNVDFDGEVKNRFQVVDGQQRMTTILLFVHLLDLLSGRKAIIEYGFSLKTNNNSNADTELNNVVNQGEVGDIARGKKGKADTANLKNIYDINIRLLNNKVEDYYKDCDKSKYPDMKTFADSILDYVLSNLYVVVLETDSKVMRLPEIVDVFNTINTTGLALDDSDIFKLQYFDYLIHTYPEVGDQWMDRIKDCYDRIDQFNLDKINRKKIGISWVLDIYKHIICAKYGLKFDELSKSNERFFDDIFKKPNDYRDILEYEEFKRIVFSFVDFWRRMEQNEFKQNIMWSLSVQLIDSTRYLRYWTVPFVYVYFNTDSQSSDDELEVTYNRALENSFAIARLFIVNSVNFAKVINPVQSIMCNDILPKFAKKEDVVTFIDNIIWESPYSGDPRGEFKGKTWFLDNLKKDTFNNSRAWLLCLLVAIIREIEEGTSIERIKNLLFNSEENPYDIEHIYSRSKFMEDNLFKQDEQEIFNAIGNLVVLEREINREMGRRQALLPSEKDKPEYYHRTKYVAAKDITPYLKSWDLKAIENRRKTLEKMLLDLLSSN